MQFPFYAEEMQQDSARKETRSREIELFGMIITLRQKGKQVETLAANVGTLEGYRILPIAQRR